MSNTPAPRPLGILDIEITDSMRDPLLMTPNRMALVAATGDLPALESPEMASVLSGKPGMRLRTTEMDIFLSKDEVLRMYRHELRPNEVRSLIERFGVFHEVHEDFYDPDTFEALQPMGGEEEPAAVEARLLRSAAAILDRNVQRSPVVSRKDNNWLFEAVFELRAIADRIEVGYESDRSSDRACQS